MSWLIRRLSVLVQPAIVGVVALLGLAWHPEWREYLAEGVLAMALLGAARGVTGLRSRQVPVLPIGSSSLFDRARETTDGVRVVPAQLAEATRLTAVLGTPSSMAVRDLLVESADRRLQLRHGCELRSARAREVLGDHVHDLLTGASRPTISIDDTRAVLDVLEEL